MIASPQPQMSAPNGGNADDQRGVAEDAIERRRADARRRLESRAALGTEPVAQYRRPPERPFSASERDRVTILFGGLTTKHERLIQAVFESCGYSAQPLPQPDLAACHIGKRSCDNGICNPAYFTIGSLIRYLQQLELSGLSRPEIADRYVFFTAGNCGPCRFGMYEAQYRLALRNAGFDGFRVLLFRQDDGVKADTGEPGLKLSLHLGLGVVNALNFADALQAFAHEVRPYERAAGTTDRRVEQALERAAALLAGRRSVCTPAWLSSIAGSKMMKPWVNVYAQLYAPWTADAIEACRVSLENIEVDRLRVKPVVKVTGEFWAQSTEGDGNFRMFDFLEREGAHVLVEPLGGWVLFLLEQWRARQLRAAGTERPQRRIGVSWRAARYRGDRGHAWRLRFYTELGRAAVSATSTIAAGTRSACRTRCSIRRELARLADPFYRALRAGGEGHLEVAKNIYYTTRQAAHMVLSLKPFGCMPSTQSDGVQSAVARAFQGHDLPVDRDGLRRRADGAQPRADGAGRGPRAGPGGIPAGAGHDRSLARRHPAVRGRAPGAAPRRRTIRAAPAGRGRTRRELRAARQRSDGVRPGGARGVRSPSGGRSRRGR